MLNSNWQMRVYILEKVTLAKTVKLILTNDPFVYAHLWFLLALFYCYLCCMLFREKTYPRKLVKIYPVLLLLFFSYALWKEKLGISASIPIKIGNSEANIMKFNFFFLRALPWFFMGMYLRLKEENIRKLSIRKDILIAAILFGSVWSVFERALFLESQFYMGTCVVVSALLIWAIKFFNMGTNWLEFIGKNLSLYVYIIHIAVGKSYDLFVTKCFPKSIKSNLYIYNRPFLIICTSLLIAYAIYATKLNIKKRKLVDEMEKIL